MFIETPLMLILVGFIILGVSSEAFIRGAVTTVHTLRVPPILVGLTIISVGTSAPELTVSLSAALEGEVAIVIGNVIGSNIANVLLIMGVMATLRPFVVGDIHLRRDGGVMLAASLVLLGLAFYGMISFTIGVMLLIALVGYVVYLYYDSRRKADASITANAEDGIMRGGLWLGFPMLIIGLAGIIWGADLMVSGGVQFAEQIGVSSGVIALSLVAIGTSLPELAVSVTACLRGQAGLAIGNIIGSNIANILLILGASALVTPLVIPPEMFARDIWVMLAVAVLGIYMIGRGSMNRGTGICFLVFYSVYIAILFG